MRINLAQLKLKPRQSESFSLQGSGNNDYLQGTGCVFLDKIVADLQVENTGQMFLVRGKVKTLLGLPCSRCLRETRLTIDSDIELTMMRAGVAEEFAADEDIIFFHGDVVDLSPAIHDTIFLAIPLIPLCQPECKGICPFCGKDQNQETCTCAQKEIDPRWEKLRNL